MSQLTWATTEEINSDRFDIERSGSSKSWVNTGSVQSGGESVSIRNYTFSDISPLPGINYYRLKMVDRAAANRKDARFGYSRIVSLSMNDSEMVIYPNPVINEISFQGNYSKIC